MNMNKSLIALAVSGAFVVPGAAQAAEAYGSINTTLESSSVEDAGGAGVIYNTNDDDTGFSMSDTFESRFGFTGSEDLGNGLEAGYTFEFGIGTSGSFGGEDADFAAGVTDPAGSVNEDSGPNTRLANLSLSGDFGTVKAGTQWGVLYEYAGWNNYRSDGHGGAGHYYMTNGTAFLTSKDPSGLRIDNALTYTYGGGGYSSDPFTFSVQVQSNQNAANNGNDEESIDAVVLGAQGTIGDALTINGTYYSENNGDDANGDSQAEPSMFTLGGRYSFGPGLVSLTYYTGDRDTESGDNDSPNALVVYGNYDFGGGLSGMASVSVGDNDADDDTGDLSAFFLQLQQELSSRTKVYGEFESATLDGGPGDDLGTDTLAVGLKHSF